MKDTIELEFITNYPCMYGGNILCKNCSYYSNCDMKQGRKLHQEYFKAGYKLGIKKGELKFIKYF